MKKILALSPALVSVLLVSPFAADDEFKVTRFGENVAIFQIGQEYTTNVVALASRRGLDVLTPCSRMTFNFESMIFILEEQE